MTLTKKHFIKIASILKKYESSEILCEELAEVFKQTNPKFDLIKFKEACLN